MCSSWSYVVLQYLIIFKSLRLIARCVAITTQGSLSETTRLELLNGCEKFLLMEIQFGIVCKSLSCWWRGADMSCSLHALP